MCELWVPPWNSVVSPFFSESLLGDGDVGEGVRDEQAAVLQLGALEQLVNTRVHARRQVGHVTAEVGPPQNDVVKYQTSVESVAASAPHQEYHQIGCSPGMTVRMK